MMALLMITSTLCVVLIAMCGWLFDKVKTLDEEIERLSKKNSAIVHALDRFDNNITSISLKVARLNEITDDQHEEIEKIKKSVETFGAAQEEAAEQIAKQIEKKWDDGLQSMLAWSPFDESEVK
jgi:methyl-accepting chemotaxis protein